MQWELVGWAILNLIANEGRTISLHSARKTVNKGGLAAPRRANDKKHFPSSNLRVNDTGLKEVVDFSDGSVHSKKRVGKQSKTFLCVAPSVVFRYALNSAHLHGVHRKFFG